MAGSTSEVSWTIGKGNRWAFVLPATLVLLAIGLFPLIYSLVVSFQNITMTSGQTSFVGLRNYSRMLGDTRLWAAFGHTLFITAIALPVETILGLAGALLFQRPMFGRPILLGLLIMPTVIAPIVAGAMWRLMFNDRFGPVNQILTFLAGEPVNILWTVKPEWIYPAILIAEVWQWTPFMLLLSIAALSTVDQSLLEAARVDGASAWRIFRRVVIPSIAPILAVAVLIRGLDLIRLFDIVWVMTRGGPGSMSETISIYVYLQGFSAFSTSYTGALTILMAVLFSIGVIIAIKRLRIAS
ncbi:multiple sugar transport system permease protein [Rhodoligotrophos appendicifer]|uniref:carbohydrate ABC transporter permease n=1 Tax=Rhodoligotrophos appendicifer TaxID=987056 RepID=UPI001185E444|nr:sugar ABC transporter permease [Rhodoligotrophos appendicifer]